MNIKVTSDSTCDLPKELLEQYSIDLVPLIIMKEEEEFLDNVTITPNDIFSHVDAGGNLCTTAARSVAVYEELFAKYAKDYDGVIHISLGSGFSSSYQNASIAAQSFKRPGGGLPEPVRWPRPYGPAGLPSGRSCPEPGGNYHEAGGIHRKGGDQLRIGPAGLYGQGRPLLYGGSPGRESSPPEALH